MESTENKKLNIAMLGQKRVPSREGGIEVVVENLSKRMVALGHKVTCLNRKGKSISGNNAERVSEFSGVKVKEVFTIDYKGLAATISSFFACLYSCFHDFDVVHVHAEGPAFFCFLPKWFGKKVVVTVHGLDWDRTKWNSFAKWYIKQGEKNAVKYADVIIVLSQALKQYFKSEYNRDTVYIPNGVDRYENVEAKEIKKWGLSKDSYILYVGRIVPEKGEHYLAEAFKSIKTDKKLVIAGETSDTVRYGRELKTMCESDDRIIFTGFVQGRALRELYSNAYIYCLPSDLEGMPLTLLEAMSFGNCCVVSDIDECKEVVQDNGVVFKKGNVKDLKDKLEWLLSDKEAVYKYKAEAADFICSKYNWDDTVNKTLMVYR